MKEIGRLEEILGEQLSLYEEILAAAERKRDALVDVDMEGLERAVADEEALTERAMRAEKARAKAVASVAGELSLPEQVSLRRLMKSLEEPLAGRLGAIRTRLMEILGELGRINSLNAALIEQSLDHVRSFLQIVADAANPQPAYERPGIGARVGACLMDQTA